MELDPKQREAIVECCDMQKRIVCVTGAAGSGKTTILKMAYEAVLAAGWKPALCAPTGKAAKRIYEATGIDAYTIHRLLEFSHPGEPDPKTGKPLGYSKPKRDRQNPLEFDVVFVDEGAMVGHDLMRSLYDAIPQGGGVRIFGDNNQLAPVEENKNYEGKPSPFLSLLENPKFTSIRLEQIFRQGQDSGILLNANNILKRRHTTNNPQWLQKFTDEPINFLREYLLQCEDDGYSFADIDNQLIVPQSTSWVGTNALNYLIQGLYHNREDEYSLLLDRKPWVKDAKGNKGGKIEVFKGDKVIVTENIYELGVFNGETGLITDLNEETGEVTVDFGDREKVFPPVILVPNQYGNFSSVDPRKSLSLAYAITTHKSQGSEYKRVIYIINKSNMYMLNRRNFYTAVTRAREHVTLIADQRGIAAALQKGE